MVIIKCINIIIMVLNMKVKMMVLNIICIGVIVGLVSITPGHVKLDWLPPPKVDRVNENNKDNKSDSKYNEDDKDDNNKNEDE